MSTKSRRRHHHHHCRRRPVKRVSMCARFPDRSYKGIPACRIGPIDRAMWHNPMLGNLSRGVDRSKTRELSRSIDCHLERKKYQKPERIGENDESELSQLPFATLKIASGVPLYYCCDSIDRRVLYFHRTNISFQCPVGDRPAVG